MKTEADLVVPGLLYSPQFLSPVEATEVIAAIDASPWRTDLKRRVQHYGWVYDYRARTVDSTMYLGDLPPWARHLANRLHNGQLLERMPDQVIVNEYVGSQGIGKHIDCPPCFSEEVAMISLLESWEMIFRLRERKHSVILEANSAAILTGDARYKWTHELPFRQKERDGTPRIRRVSVTFRRVLANRPSN